MVDGMLIRLSDSESRSAVELGLPRCSATSVATGLGASMGAPSDVMGASTAVAEGGVNDEVTGEGMPKLLDQSSQIAHINTLCINKTAYHVSRLTEVPRWVYSHGTKIEWNMIFQKTCYTN